MSTVYSYEITKSGDNVITLVSRKEQNYQSYTNTYRISWDNHPLKLNLTIFDNHPLKLKLTDSEHPRIEPDLDDKVLPLRIRTEDMVKWVLKHIYIEPEHVTSVTNQLISCGLGITEYRTTKTRSVKVVDLDTNGLNGSIVVEIENNDTATTEHFAVYSTNGVFGLYSMDEADIDKINAVRTGLNMLNLWCLETKIFDIIKYPRKGVAKAVDPLKLFKYYLKLEDLGVKTGLEWQGDKLTLWYDLGAVRWNYDGMDITMLANDDVECRTLTDHEIQLYLDAINNSK